MHFFGGRFEAINSHCNIVMRQPWNYAVRVADNTSCEFNLSVSHDNE